MHSAHRLIKRYIIGAYASFLAMVGLCIGLYPAIFDNYTYGISYFGSVTTTMIPYFLGFTGTIICMVAIARQLRPFGSQALPLRLAFLVGASLMAGVAATSYSLNDTIFLTHILCTILLALNQLAITAWIVVQKDAKPLDYVLAAVFTVVGIVSVLPIIHDLPVLRSFPLREIIAFVCAMGLVGRAALRVSATKTQVV